MPDYRLTVTFGAADDRQAQRLGHEWAGTMNAEYGTSNPIVTPADGELRGLMAEAVLVFFGHAGAGRTECSVRMAKGIADAVLAVRDAELERLRAALNATRTDVDAMQREVHRHVSENVKLQQEAERLRGELETERALADEHASNLDRLHGELAEARDRSEQAEDRLRVATDAYTRLQAQADDGEAARDRWKVRAKEAESRVDGQAWDDLEAERDVLIDEVKTLQGDLEAFGEAQKAWVQFRRERDALKAAIERVRALHVIRGRNIHGDDVCAECSPLQPYPCSTIAALDAPSEEKTEDASSVDRWSCPRCGSDRWVAASLTGPVEYGGRAIKQCVPCGYYSGDSVDAPSGAESGE